MCGISGLAVAGRLDGSQDGIFRTTAIGASLLGLGIAELAAGTLLLAIPDRARNEAGSE